MYMSKILIRIKKRVVFFYQGKHYILGRFTDNSQYVVFKKNICSFIKIFLTWWGELL